MILHSPPIPARTPQVIVPAPLGPRRNRMTEVVPA